MLIRYFSRSDGGVRRYRRGELKDYMELLVRNFNPDTTETLMCSNTLSVGWDGRIFDCDFNQQLELGKILRDLGILLSYQQLDLVRFGTS